MREQFGSVCAHQTIEPTAAPPGRRACVYHLLMGERDGGETSSRRAFIGGAVGLGVIAASACTSKTSSVAGQTTIVDGNIDSPGSTAPGETAPAAGVRTAIAPIGRSQHATALLPGGLVLVIGGLSAFGMLNSCQVLDPSDGIWTDAAPLKLARGLLTANQMPDGKVLCLGGFTGSAALTVGSVFDPVADKWSPVAPLATPRFEHSTQALGDGRFVVTGGTWLAPLTLHEVYELR